MKKGFFIIVIILFLMLFTAKPALASEGIVELTNINGAGARCFAMSTSVNRSTNFQILVQCRNLIYPIEPAGTYYVLWAVPRLKDAKPWNLGDIGFGKGIFSAPDVFTKLFITKELNLSPNQPSNDKVMEGNIQPISFLGTIPTPTPTPLPALKISPTKSPAMINTNQISQAPQQKSGGSFTVIILIIFLIIVIIFIIAIIIYIINRFRR